MLHAEKLFFNHVLWCVGMFYKTNKQKIYGRLKTHAWRNSPWWIVELEPFSPLLQVEWNNTNLLMILPNDRIALIEWKSLWSEIISLSLSRERISQHLWEEENAFASSASKNIFHL